MAATEVPDASLRSEHKKWVLKVSIDCAGCGKKVRKALHGIEGVHSTQIDLKQQKVTVIGNVDAETLIRRLVKTTKKAAEVCPDESPAAKNKSEKVDIKANRDAAHKNRDLQTEARSEDPSSSSSGGALAKDTSSDAPSKDGDGDCVGKNSNSGSPEKKSDGSSGVSSPASGNGGKKKKRKGQKRNVDVADGGSAPNPTHVVAEAAAGDGSSPTPSPPTSAGQTAVNQPSNPSPPRQRAHQHPPPAQHQYAYAVPSPVLNYSNMARSTGFSSASYYSPPPALSSYSYAYDHDVPGVEMGMGPPRPPSYYSSYLSPVPPSSYQHPSQPPEFEFFSEENPNGCRVM